MPSEYMLDLCFIRPAADADRFHAEIEAEMARLSGKSGTWFAERKRQGDLDLSIVQMSGLTALRTEEEVKGQLESRMASDCWEWLSGYRLTVIPKVDAGSCSMKRRQGSV